MELHQKRGEELDPDYLNSVQDQVNAAKDYIINEINTKLAEQGGIAKPRYGFLFIQMHRETMWIRKHWL